MKIRIVGAQLFHVDGRTHMTELIIAFRNFANAPRNATFWLQREFTWYSVQTFAPYIIEWFLIPRPCVYCAVRIEYLYLLQVNFLRKVLSKMGLQEVGGGCGDWMELAQDRDRWRALVSTVMNLRVPNMRGISWLAAEPVSFSRRTLLHGVSK